MTRRDAPVLAAVATGVFLWILDALVVTVAAASTACPAAPGVVALTIARGLQGVAAAVLLPSSLALLRQAFPNNARRATAIGAWSAVSGLAGVIGPVLAGAASAGPDGGIGTCGRHRGARGDCVESSACHTRNRSVW
jgi:MFS family permease